MCVLLLHVIMQTCQYIKSIFSVFLRVCRNMHCVRTCTRNVLQLLLSEQHSGISHVFLVDRQRGTATTEENRSREERRARTTRSNASLSMARRRVLIVINRNESEESTLTRHPQSNCRRARTGRHHLFKLILACHIRIRQLVFTTPRGVRENKEGTE